MRQEEQDSETRKLLDKAKSEILRDIDFDKKPRYRGMRPAGEPSALDQLMDTEMLDLPGPSWVDEVEAAEADRRAAAGVETFEDMPGKPGWFSRIMSSITPEVSPGTTGIYLTILS